MAQVYWNQNNGQETPITPSDLVGVGDSIAYDALSVISPNSAGGLVVANKTGNGGIDSFTKLMLHLDNNVIDSSLVPKTITNVGCTFSNTTSKFSYSALDAANAYLTTPSSSDFAFGTGNFTIDFWFYRNAINGGSDTLFSQVQDFTSNYSDFYMYGTSSNISFEYRVVSGGVTQLDIFGSTGVPLSLNAWHHIAVIRGWGGNPNTVVITLDGVAVLTSSAYSGSVPTFTCPLDIGRAAWSDQNRYVNGYFDEYRVSKGIARWTTNFTPLAGPYDLVSNGVAGTPYMKLGYVNGSAITQTAKIWTDSAASNALKFDLASATRLVVTDSDIQFNGTSLLPAGVSIWSDVAGVITPTTPTDVFSIGGVIPFCGDLMQISANATFSGNLTVTGSANIASLSATSLTVGSMTVDASGNLVAPSITFSGSAIRLSSTVNSSIAIGYGATAPAVGHGTAIGFNAQVVNGFALGTSANASGTSANCIGYNSVAAGNSATAIGDHASAAGNNSFALGYSATVDATSISGIAIGNEAEVAGAIGGVAIGDSAMCQGNNTVVIGATSTASSAATSSVAIGIGATVSGSQSVAIGNSSAASASFALAFGVSSIAHGLSSAAFGYNAKANADYSLALGFSSDAEGIGATAIGYHAVATGTNSIAIGYYASAPSANQIVFTTEASAGVAAVQMNIVAGVADFVANVVKAPNVALSVTTVPATPVAGMIYFNGTNFKGYNGSTWKTLDNA